MGAREDVKAFLENHPKESFNLSNEVKNALGKQLGLKPSTVGWALWTLARDKVIKSRKVNGKLIFHV